MLYSVTSPAEVGGVQAVVRRLASHLRERGHDVVTAWLEPNPNLAADEEAYDLPRLRRRRGIPTPRSSLRALRALLALRRALARHRPDVVNVHYVTCEAIYFLLLRPLYRYKLVFSVHGSDLLRPTRWDERLLPRILPRADGVTAVSLPTAARVRGCRGVDPARLRVIPNGIDFDFWSTAPSPRLAIADRPANVLAVGRLLPVKGHDVLLRAFAGVLRRVPRARLVIIGDGPSLPDLQRLAQELELGDAVELAGELDAPEVRKHLAKARAFALPSRSEGLPLVLLEAMAAGVPVVATQVGGVPDVVSSGTALIVPPEDPEALAEALCSLLLDPQLASTLSERGKQRAPHFSAAAAYTAYEDLFLHLRRNS